MYSIHLFTASQLYTVSEEDFHNCHNYNLSAHHRHMGQVSFGRETHKVCTRWCSWSCVSDFWQLYGKNQFSCNYREFSREGAVHFVVLSRTVFTKLWQQTRKTFKEEDYSCYRRNQCNYATPQYVTETGLLSRIVCVEKKKE